MGERGEVKKTMKLVKSSIMQILIFVALFSIIVVANSDIYVWERKMVVETRVEGNATYETVMYEILPRSQMGVLGIMTFLTVACVLITYFCGKYVNWLIKG